MRSSRRMVSTNTRIIPPKSTQARLPRSSKGESTRTSRRRRRQAPRQYHPLRTNAATSTMQRCSRAWFRPHCPTRIPSSTAKRSCQRFRPRSSRKRPGRQLSCRHSLRRPQTAGLRWPRGPWVQIEEGPAQQRRAPRILRINKRLRSIWNTPTMAEAQSLPKRLDTVPRPAHTLTILRRPLTCSQRCRRGTAPPLLRRRPARKRQAAAPSQALIICRVPPRAPRSRQSARV